MHIKIIKLNIWLELILSAISLNLVNFCSINSESLIRISNNRFCNIINVKKYEVLFIISFALHLNIAANINIDASSVTAKEINVPIVINTDFINFTFSIKVRANNVGSEQVNIFRIVLGNVIYVDIVPPNATNNIVAIFCLMLYFLFSKPSVKIDIKYIVTVVCIKTPIPITINLCMNYTSFQT